MEAKSSRKGQNEADEDKMPRTKTMMPGRGRWRSTRRSNEANEDENAKDKENDARERPMEAKRCQWRPMEPTGGQWSQLEANGTKRGRWRPKAQDEDKMRPIRTKMSRTRKMMPGRGQWRPKDANGGQWSQLEANGANGGQWSQGGQ
jgi:hypothetical protein